MQSVTPETFPSLTSRLNFIDLCPDHRKNIEVWHCLCVFESYVYGVISQYMRIKENLEKMKDPSFRLTRQFSSCQVRLDIYYYILTWDKLKKIYEKLKELMNGILKTSNTVSGDLKNDFRQLRRRIDHFFNEFRTAVRNEYEHPSLQPKKVGNIIEWGSLFIDGRGNIKVLVGKEEYAVVRKEHIDRLNSLWIILIDTLLKHFSEKPSSSDLLTLKNEIEDNIDLIIDTYTQYRRENKNEEANQIIHQITISDIHLTTEGIPLSQDTKDKFYSSIFGARLES